MPKVPPTPANCFSHSAANHYPRILEDGKTIRVLSFIRQPEDDWESAQDLLDLFIDFDQWGEYAKAAGTGDIAFVTSKRLPDTVIDGHQVMQHYSEYYVKGPLGIKQHIVELNHVRRRVPPYEGAELSLEFALAPRNITEIPGIGPYKPVGVQDVRGTFHISKRPTEADYVVTIQVDVLPTQDFAPNIAISYILDVGKTMVKGMFNL
ncbi:hypothetical protein [Polyangium sp. 6x1]|uniref:hypothetical protein n=1 Tax=Polyangium sp. 6x1 TaxID=3042689 RepID=UPI0024823FD2|nr:hypothetical protein [Polyangium sp. 6x1]MDI1451265.1 hypothetical protein [Polyangium sp. 6x1]